MTAGQSENSSDDPLANIDLVVFDKDGTLVDFDAMWVPWVLDVAARLETASGVELAERFFDSVGFDATTARTIAGGGLSGASMGMLRDQTVDLLEGIGLPRAAAETAVASAWYTPDPVATAAPLTDLAKLFHSLRARGLRIAVATSDDRSPTEAVLDHLGLTDMVDGIVCGDDALGVKPSPDLVHWLADRLGCPVERMAVVGDTPGDLSMGRAAGAGRCIGVLSGVGTRAELEPLADIVLPSVATLIGEIAPESR